MKADEFIREEQRLGHAIQSGVAMEMELGSKDTEPKHLRVGVNLAMAQHSALTKLLIEKGLFTEEEYFDAQITLMKVEVAMYEKRLSDLTKTKITLA